jgi:hypothetical protein
MSLASKPKASQVSLSISEPLVELLIQALRQEVAEGGALLQLLNEQHYQLFLRDASALYLSGHVIKQQSQSHHSRAAHRQAVMAQVCDKLALDPELTTLRDMVPYWPQSMSGLLIALMDEIGQLSVKIRRKTAQNKVFLAQILAELEEEVRRHHPELLLRTYDDRGKLKLFSGIKNASLDA